MAVEPMSDMEIAARRDRPMSAGPEVNRPRGRWRPGPDVVVAVSGIAVLFASALIQANKRYLWFDELATWVLVTDPSVWHMLRAMSGGLENAPPLYHLLARGWLAIWGESVLALRLFSATGFAAALALMWWALRRVHSWPATAVGVLTVFWGSAVVLRQSHEARFYGLWMAFAAATIALYALSVTRPVPPRWLLPVNALAHAAVVLTHTLGLAFSGGMLLAYLASDLMRRKARPGLWLSVVAGWLAFVPWIAPTLRQSDLAKPHTFVPIPGVSALFHAYEFSIVILPFLVLMLIAARILVPTPEPGATSGRIGPAERADARALLPVSVGLAVVPLLLFVVSHLASSVFLDRYMLPISLLWCGALAHLVAALDRWGERATLLDDARRPRLATAMWAGACLLLLVQPLYHARAATSESWPEEPLRRVADTDPETASLPVAVESGITYARLAHYAGEGASRLYFIEDWEAAIDPRAPRRAVAVHKYLDLLRRFYGGMQYRTSAAFLCDYDRFLVLDDDNIWVEREITPDSAFVVRTVGRFDEYTEIRLIVRQPGRTPLRCGRAPLPDARPSRSPIRQTGATDGSAG